MLGYPVLRRTIIRSVKRINGGLSSVFIKSIMEKKKLRKRYPFKVLSFTQSQLSQA